MKKVGNYTLLSELGQGQFGTVYKAQHTMSGELFAIKTINKGSIHQNPKLRELFDTEVHIMKSIKHDNIMHLYELLETTNNYYLVIDYCRSGDMERFVKKNNGLGESEAVYFLKQIMNGFKELHKQKIMHRDVKLANIFLNDDKVIIGDFGFAKSGRDMAQTKLGSPITMAPEILLANGPSSYTNKADIWSIGVCFFEMIFGVEPWPHVSSVEDLKRKVMANSGSRLQFPKSKHKISSECQQLLMQLIEPDQHRRISWNSFYNHKLFQIHQKKAQPQAPANVHMSLLFRNNEDRVNQQFFQNQADKTNDYDLTSDPVKLVGKVNGQIQVPSSPYNAKPKTELTKQRILERYNHEKRVMVFIIQTSVKLRNLSKDKQNLSKIFNGLMYCGILLLKKAIILNNQALDSLKRNYNIYGLEGFDQFATSADKLRLANEIEYTDVPAYQKLYEHLKQKMETEMNVQEQRTKDILRIVQDSSSAALASIEAELRRETYYLIEFFLVTSNSLSSSIRMEMLQTLASLYICSRHTKELPFLENGIPFDWYIFEKSLEGSAAVNKLNAYLNKAYAEK